MADAQLCQSQPMSRQATRGAVEWTFPAEEGDGDEKRGKRDGDEEMKMELCKEMEQTALQPRCKPQKYLTICLQYILRFNQQSPLSLFLFLYPRSF